MSVNLIKAGVWFFFLILKIFDNIEIKVSDGIFARIVSFAAATHKC